MKKTWQEDRRNENYQDFINELNKLKENMTIKDSEFLLYILTDKLWEFYTRNIDSDYKYPYIQYD